MKRHISVFIIFIIAACSMNMAAQRSQSDAQRRQWFNNMVATKVDYISKQIGLDGDKKVRFAKEYTAMTTETAKLARETRKLERSVAKNPKATDLEYEKAAEAVAEFKGREAAIEMRYYNQFKTYLSKKQLFQLKIAENKWMRELMKHRGKNRK